LARAIRIIIEHRLAPVTATCQEVDCYRILDSELAGIIIYANIKN
jgi:hypothetical protein